MIDEKFGRALQFARNLKHRNAGFSNIYVIQSIDREGNIVDENYCMNIMTDYGFTQYFKGSKNWTDSDINFYIGNGGQHESDIKYSESSLISPLTNTAATVTTRTPDYAYPLYYEKGGMHEGVPDGLITCVCRYMNCYFDYDVSGIVEDTVDITEYGIGTSPTALWTHSLVYSTSGSITSVQKTKDIRLEISVYFCMSYYESLILNNYENGIYTMITTMQRFFNRMNPSGNNNYIFKRNNQGQSRSLSNIQDSAIEDNCITKYLNIAEVTFENGKELNQGYFDGYCDWYEGFMSMERETIPPDPETGIVTPEAFDVIVKPYSPNDTCLSDRFGVYDDTQIPITQATVSNVAMYNFKSEDENKWTNNEVFTNDNNKWYTDTSLQTFFSTPIYYYNNNDILRMYVYQNMSIDDPIIKFNPNITTVYAADKYWDYDTWVHITNPLDIPEELRCKRYYITNTKDSASSLNPTRQSTGLKIHPTDGGIEDLGYTMLSSGMKAICDNYEYRWYKWANNVYAITDEGKRKYENIGEDNNETMTYGKWMIVYNSNVLLHYYDMSNLTERPTEITTTPPFSTSTNLFTQAYRTESNTGYICLQSTTCDESVVIDALGSDLTMTKFDSKKACCIYGENKIAYVPKEDVTKINIYNLDESVIQKQLDVLEGYTVATIFGLHNFVWVITTSSNMICYDLIDDTVEICTIESGVTLSNYTNTFQNMKMTAVDECLVFYRRDFGYSSYAFYMSCKNPTVVGSLSSIRASDQNNGICQYTLRYVHNNKSLALIYSSYYYSGSNYGAYNYVIDFGNYIDGNKGYILSSNSYTNPNIIPYGSYVIANTNKKIPLEYWMPHRVVGTTITISAINTKKNIRGKQYYINFTNIPAFYGKPPGHQIGETVMVTS